MVQLVRIVDDLPEGFPALRAESEAAGRRHLARLAAEWASGAERFDKLGEALLAAFAGGELAGVCGLTREPFAPDAALRLRRLYVAQAARRTGVGRALVNALLQQALSEGRQVTVNADPRSTAFWEAMGFRPAGGRPWTHAYAG